MDKIKNNITLILTVITIILVLLNLKQCSNNSALKQDAKKFDQSIAALHDSIRKTVNSKGDTVFAERVVEYGLDDIVNSEAFKSLSKEKQKFYLELDKTKGLLASSQATIESQAKLIENLNYNKDTVKLNDSTICYNKGAKEIFIDSTGNLKYTHTLTFGNTLSSNFSYKYMTNIQTSYIRNKDKTITIEYKLNDPNAVVTQAQSFIVPQEQKTKFQKFMGKTGKWLISTAAAIAGGYIGYKLK